MPARTRAYLALASTAALAVTAPPLVASADPVGALPERAVAQIRALAAAKAARTPAQAKVESALLTAAQQASGRRLPVGVRVTSRVRTDRSGRAEVQIRGSVTSSLLDRVRASGGVVRYHSSVHGVVRADVPLDSVTRLAALPQVDRVESLAAGWITSATEARSADPLPRVAAAAAGETPVTSEGDRTHGVDEARDSRHLSGVGVTVGVLSDGVDSLPESIAAGELPPDVVVLPTAAGRGDEGTAMLEIVHDLAPKAGLMFATATAGEAGFADNIRALGAAGADVIVDDFMYADESPFQDGPVARAVTDVSRRGVSYFSAAGNHGNLDDHTSGNYEADFRPSGRSIGKFVGVAHDFDPGAGVQVSDPTTQASAGLPAILQWADPLGAAADDYDLYAIDASGNVVGFSNDVQDGDDDPFESMFPSNADGPSRLVVVKYRGASRYFKLSVPGGRFGADGSAKGYASPGVTRGHSAASSAVSVGAVPAAAPSSDPSEPGDPPNPSGPFPARFTAQQLSERFTSDGPRRVFFTPDGTPITPGNLTATGGRVRAKPNVVAADGVSTSRPGFSPFFGSSASAAHAAAIAALARSGNPDLTPAGLRTALAGTAVDIERPGRDRDTGAGIIDAPAFLAAVQARGQPFVTAGSPIVVTSADGDTFLEPGERGTVGVPVTNRGDVAARRVRVVLRASTPGLVVSAPRQAYGTVATGTTSHRAFEVTVPSGSQPGTSVGFRVRVRFRGAYSPQLSAGSIPVGEPPPAATTASHAGRPIAGADGGH